LWLVALKKKNEIRHALSKPFQQFYKTSQTQAKCLVRNKDSISSSSMKHQIHEGKRKIITQERERVQKAHVDIPDEEFFG